MKHLVVLFAFVLGFMTQAQAQTPPIVERTFSDDSYVHVPLQFGFPFFGKTFTNSWMHSNGVVSFLDPAAPIQGAGYNPGAWAYCCSGVQPTINSPQFSYMIAPLWTDLYPVWQSRFTTQGDSTFQKYSWENIAEISNMSNLNTFALEIRPSGFIGATYSAINIQNQQTWSGVIGDTSKSEWNEIYYGVGVPGQSLKNWNLTDTGVIDQCIINPLSSPTCAGYTEAMCSTNALYSSACAGYQQAYLTQQCAINPLYNTSCPGYAAAYLDQQCSLDALYSTVCVGYEQAYFDQQCSLDPLYSKQCQGYEKAYAKKYLIELPQEAAVAIVEPQQVQVTEQPQPAQTTVSEVAAVQITSPQTTTKVENNVTSPSASQSATTTSSTTSVEKKDAPKTTRQQLAQRRLEAARAKAVERAPQAASNMDSATTMEQQAQTQNVVLSAMGFVPGFDAYGKAFIPDGVSYKPFTIYNNQKTVDNANMLRGLSRASDKLHNALVDSQYNKN